MLCRHCTENAIHSSIRRWNFTNLFISKFQENHCMYFCGECVGQEFFFFNFFWQINIYYMLILWGIINANSLGT